MRVLFVSLVHWVVLLNAGDLHEEIVLPVREDVVIVAESNRRLLSARSREDNVRRLKKDKVAQKAICQDFSQSDIESKGSLLVKVEIEKARDLPKLSGAWGMKDIPDGYVTYEVKVGGETYTARTDVIKNKQDPEWKDSCKFPVPSDVSEVTIDAEVWDHNDNREDKRIGTFKKKVRYKQALSGTDQEATLEDCSACKKPAVVTLAATWASATSSSGKKNSKGKGGGFPWIWLIVGIVLLVLGGIFGAIALMMRSKSSSATQETPARNALVGSEMQPQWQRQAPQGFNPPPQQYRQQAPPVNYQQSPLYSQPGYQQSGGGAGKVTVNITSSGPYVAHEVSRF